LLLLLPVVEFEIFLFNAVFQGRVLLLNACAHCCFAVQVIQALLFKYVFVVFYAVVNWPSIGNGLVPSLFCYHFQEN
jgi:hypothetical protein